MKLIPDYLGREQCDSVKGIFILWVFVSHFMGYVAKVGGYVVPVYIGQMMVTLFLFYSGYGVMESIKKKGDDYVRAMPKRRILTTLLNFDVAVLVFVALNLLLGNPMTLKQIALSFVCWDSVGNSNWYIFAIIYCYASVYLAYSKIFGVRYRSLFCLFLLLLYIGVMSYFKGYCWFDTILCFYMGMVYSEYRYKVENLAKYRYWTLISCFLLAYLFFDFSSTIISVRGILPNIKAMCFVGFVIALTMRFRIRHSALVKCGKNLFPIYIYQRVPMLVCYALDPQGLASWRMPIYFCGCLFLTLMITYLYPKWRVKIS